MLQRSKHKALLEGLIEWIIRICGISAVVFVFAIFLFVFWQGKGLIFRGGFDFWKFLTTKEW